MAEEIQKKKISELPSAVYLSDEDVMPVVQGSGSSEATKKADIGLVGSTVAESKTFSNLDTTSKTLVGAINEVNSSLGNVPSADEISYDNTSSGLSASDVQGAIDEIAQGGSGGSTVTVTQIQATGTKIATITVDSVDTDLYAPQGGGSGGHTILDDEGTSLTQRDDLQFKGAYSEDDSTNDKTVVNVARTMTLAEFEQLTDDEKAGFINVKDETSGSDDKFQPVIYSEEEREIGVWIDGKPLYQKTVYIATITGPSTTAAHGISDLDWIVDYSLIGLYAGQTREIAPSNGSYGTIGVVIGSWDSTNIEFDVGNLSYGFSDCYLTIRYTKSTDQAGSGQWTPQGVPSHHYLTDEQVVGTWIDGSTLYEKTVVGDGTYNEQFNYIPHGVTNLDKIIDYFGYCTYAGTEFSLIPYLRGDTYITVTVWDSTNIRVERTGLSSSFTGVRLVIRYTKSST